MGHDVTGYPWTQRLGLVLFGLATAAAAAPALHTDLAVLAHPWPLDYGEGPLLDQARRLAEGQSLYPADLSTPPWIVSNYPPLLPWLLAVLAPLDAPLTAGRWIAFGAGLVAAALLGVLASAPARRWAGAVTAALFLLAPWTTYWMPLLRVDLPALALTVAGLVAAVTGRRPWRAPLAGLLVGLAAATRQTHLLPGPLALIAWASHPDHHDEAPPLGLGWAGGLLAGLALMGLAGGEGAWTHLVMANLDPWRADLLWTHALEFPRHAPLLLLAGLAGLATLRMRRSRDRLVLGWFVGALVTATLVGKVGANANYLLELLAALALLAGRLATALTDRPLLRDGLLLLLATQLVTWAHPHPVPGRYHAWLTDRLATAHDRHRLAEAIRALPDPILADEDLGLLVLQDRPVWLQPFERTQLAARGAWDPAPLVEGLREGRFAAVIIHRGGALYQERWPPAALQALRRHYRPADRYGDTFVLVPARGP